MQMGSRPTLAAPPLAPDRSSLHTMHKHRAAHKLSQAVIRNRSGSEPCSGVHELWVLDGSDQASSGEWLLRPRALTSGAPRVGGGGLELLDAGIELRTHHLEQGEGRGN